MAIYYVDFSGGDDTKDGQSVANAWKTITKVNAAALVAGDSVLFKRGETWTGIVLNVTWSGALNNPITFGAYGDGSLPVIDGNNVVNCIIANNAEHLTFENIECAQGLDYGFGFSNSDFVTMTDCEAHGCGNDNVIFITGCHDCTVTRGRFYNAYERTPTVTSTGIEIADDCYNITITGAECYDNEGTYGQGISIHSHAATGIPYNVILDGCVCYGNDVYGIQIAKQNNVAESSRNILIRNCTAYDNGTGGIRITTTVANYSNGIMVDGCHSRDNGTRALFLQGDNLTIRRSMFDGVVYATACDGLKFHNNTCYLPAGAGAYALYLANARAASNEVKNCVVYCAASGGMAIGVDATVTAAEVDIDYNLYYLAAEAITAARWYWRGTAYGYADWLTNSTQDANSPAPANPLFVSVPDDNFRLQSGSPAIGAGTDVGLFYSGAAPDLGAYERWARRGATRLHLAGAHEEDD